MDKFVTIYRLPYLVFPANEGNHILRIAFYGSDRGTADTSAQQLVRPILLARNRKYNIHIMLAGYSVDLRPIIKHTFK